MLVFSTVLYPLLFRPFIIKKKDVSSGKDATSRFCQGSLFFILAFFLSKFGTKLLHKN